MDNTPDNQLLMAALLATDTPTSREYAVVWQVFHWRADTLMGFDGVKRCDGPVDSDYDREVRTMDTLLRRWGVDPDNPYEVQWFDQQCRTASNAAKERAAGENSY